MTDTKNPKSKTGWINPMGNPGKDREAEWRMEALQEHIKKYERIRPDGILFDYVTDASPKRTIWQRITNRVRLLIGLTKLRRPE